MKLKTVLKIISVMLFIPIIFITGMLVGNIYNVTDILCPSKAVPHILERDFMSKDGIVIPKGTVIALRECEYMQRFNYQFAIDNATELKQHAGKTDAGYGFAELFPKNE